MYISELFFDNIFCYIIICKKFAHVRRHLLMHFSTLLDTVNVTASVQFIKDSDVKDSCLMNTGVLWCVPGSCECLCNHSTVCWWC